ncbi:MAG TPA: CHAP domain-containing protein [Kutzneria sp.]|nr:CHAP domain-containing protein [Kutzneria sp.]
MKGRSMPALLRRMRAAVVAIALALGCVTAVAVQSSPVAHADATCSANVSVYGVLADNRLTYTSVDPDNGNMLHIITSGTPLPFTAKAMATLNANTILITSTAGELYRVDVITNNTSLTYATAKLQSGWTHNLLTYDGHGHIYGTTTGGQLLQYLMSAKDGKPGELQVGQRVEIGSGGFYLKTLAAAADDRLIATTSDGQLISYAINATGGYTRAQLDNAGWQSFENLVSPGGGLYYGKNPDGAMYWYEDADPTDGRGNDITYHLDDPVASRGWTQMLLSADPSTCTTKPVVNPLRGKIVAAATGEVGTIEKYCDKYNTACNEGGTPWCAMFATWAWWQAGVADVPRGTLAARGLGEWGVNHHLFKSRSSSTHGSPKPGDWAIYGPPDGVSGGHVDVVTAVHPDGTLTVVGGNVSNAVRQRVIDPATASQNGHSISGYVSPPGA